MKEYEHDFFESTEPSNSIASIMHGMVHQISVENQQTLESFREISTEEETIDDLFDDFC